MADQTTTQGKKVLLVEDDLFLSNILGTRLAKAGLNVVKAMNGEEAVKAVESGRPDLILLDIIIPKRSGFEVLEEIKSDPSFRSVPVIIVSNLGQETDVERGKKLGVVEYFVKAQTSIDDIVDSVKRHLGSAA